MTLIVEALLLWALINHLSLSLIWQVVCILLFMLGRVGLVNIDFGGGRGLKL